MISKNFASVIIIGLFCFSCAKIEREDILLEKPVPGSCSNGVQDPGETAIDCGGLCPPCTSVTAPCTPDANTVSFTGFPDVTYTGVSETQKSDYYKLSDYMGPTSVDIYFEGQKPTSDRTYKIVDGLSSASSLWPGEASITLTQPGGIGIDYYYSNTGTIYVNVDSTTITVTYCESWFGGSTYSTAMLRYP